MTDMRTPPWPTDSRYLRTSDLLIDLRYRRATCGDAEVELPQRLFDLLLLLMAEPHKLHSRTELFARLWPGVIVEDANLSQSMWLLRKALGEQRKEWIRTVAKGGYVFEPPGPIEAFADLPPTAIGTQAVAAPTREAVEVPGTTTASDGAAPEAGDAVAGLRTFVAASAIDGALQPQVRERADQRPRLHNWRGWAVAASVLAAIAIGVLWQRAAKPEVVPTTPLPPLAVVLIDVEDRESSAHWPVKLLHEWLGWKLGSLPEVTLLTEAEFAADTRSTAPQVVFLSSGSTPGDPGQVLLRARFQEAGREQRIERSGPVSQVPAMVDGLSRQLMARLVPQRTEPWPALILDARAARRYADAVNAIERRDSMAAAVVLGEVVKLAPRFGLARMQLAQAQARLAQASSAVEQMDAARQLLQPAPVDVIALLNAQRLAIDPQHQPQAVEAFAKLVARFPHKTAYVLEYADQLVVTGQPQQALKLLSAPHWEREPIGTRIARLIALTQVHHALGDPERVRQNARAAERLARDAGAGWELELGVALLQVAIADTMQYKERAGTQLYEQAAKQLELAGNHTLVLYARFLAEIAAPPLSGPNPRMDALLVEARKGGYRSLEIDILARVAGQHYSAGDLVTYRRLLEEALVAAQAAGNDQARNQLTLALLVEDIVGARFDSADRRLQQLRSLKFQGAPAVVLNQLDASLDAFRGHYARSIQTLDRADRQLAVLQAGPTSSETQATLACVRAGSRLPLGDLADARSDLKRCAASGAPTTQLLAMTARAQTELLAGDRIEAENLLRRTQATLPTLPDGPERWESTINIALLLTRIGDTVESDRLYAQVLPKLRAVGYLWFTANIEAGLAENAAARDDWTASRQHSANARRDVPADAWSLTSRLDVLDIAAALASGDRIRAVSLASQIHAEAQRLGDRLTQMQVHSLLPQDSLAADCGRAHRDTMAASSGMRAATLDWLNPKPTQSEPRQVVSAE